MRMPNGRARWAIASPIRPSPTISSVFPVSSPGPSERDLRSRSHRRASCARNSLGIPRVNISIIAITCSAMFGPCTPLAFVIATPRASSAGVMISSSPAATELSQRRRGARASSSSESAAVTAMSAPARARAKSAPSAAPSPAANVSATRPSKRRERRAEVGGVRGVGREIDQDLDELIRRHRGILARRP